MGLDDKLGKLLVTEAVGSVSDDAEDVEPGEDGLGQVDILSKGARHVCRQASRAGACLGEEGVATTGAGTAALMCGAGTASIRRGPRGTGSSASPSLLTVAPALRVCRSDDAASGLELGDDACLRNGDALLLHSLVNRNAVLVVHLVKLRASGVSLSPSSLTVDSQHRSSLTLPAAERNPVLWRPSTVATPPAVCARS